MHVLPGQFAFVEHTLLMFVPPAHLLGIRLLVPTWHSASLAHNLLTLPVEHLGGTSARLHVPGVIATLFFLTALNDITLVLVLGSQLSVTSSQVALGGHGSPECKPQLPPLHVSLPLQNNPSSQELELFAWTQPLDGLHESSVHSLLSLQSMVVPLQEPLEQ
ncbi:MAG: hypothetical protein AAB385_09530 [Planctomycetota bacterium]|jgi:hypothetical protein